MLRTINSWRNFGVTAEIGNKFYSGLTLSRENKLSIADAVYKPHSLFRYLYRPFLIWNVDGNDLVIVGQSLWHHFGHAG